MLGFTLSEDEGADDFADSMQNRRLTMVCYQCGLRVRGADREYKAHKWSEARIRRRLERRT